jgi:hypothetical protein
MEANINNAKLVIKQEIGRLSGILGNLNATLAYLESLGKPTATLAPTCESQAAAAGIVSAPAVDIALVEAPIAPPAPLRPATPASSNPYPAPLPSPASAEAANQLQRDIDAWKPKLNRVSLEDLYLVATLDRPKHLPQLPSALDMQNTEVLRVMGNYLRHTEVIGYREFCARLKAFTGLSHLYKRMRDKATSAINTTYPELADGTIPFTVNNEKPVPSGAVQFAALATLLPLSASAQPTA